MATLALPQQHRPSSAGNGQAGHGEPAGAGGQGPGQAARVEGGDARGEERT